MLLVDEAAIGRRISILANLSVRLQHHRVDEFHLGGSRLDLVSSLAGDCTRPRRHNRPTRHISIEIRSDLIAATVQRMSRVRHMSSSVDTRTLALIGSTAIFYLDVDDGVSSVLMRR